ncbi:hypothetical protein DUGA2_46590 [Duganella sp. HH101]|nr:hypothetical protein DUGA2_46590 [Duganella sp. HH101]
MHFRLCIGYRHQEIIAGLALGKRLRNQLSRFGMGVKCSAIIF